MSAPLIRPFPFPLPARVLAPAGPMRAVTESFCSLHRCGRDAIYWAFRGMSPAPGTIAWLPAFHCGVEVQAALDAGLEVGFYRIREDLTIDEADLERKLAERPGPLMVTHYYGFAQPGIERLAARCEARGLPLIEDCSHSLFAESGGRPLGRFGPLSIFSIYKTLDLIWGGALWVDRDRLRRCTGRPFIDPDPPARASLVYHLGLRFFMRHSIPRSWLEGYRQWRYGRSDGPVRAADGVVEHPMLTEPQDYTMPMPALTRRMVDRYDPAGIMARRREHWQALDARLAGRPGYQPVFARLDAGACPLFLPIRVSRRAELVAALRRRGIETFVFGEYPHPILDPAAAAEAAPLREQILCLPVHQRLDARQIEHLAEALIELLPDHAPSNPPAPTGATGCSRG